MAVSRVDLDSYEPDLTVVPAPEIGEGATVKIRAMSAGEVSKVQPLMASDNIAAGLKVFSFVVVNDDGEQLYSHKDMEAVRRLPWSLVERVAELAIKLSAADGDADGGLEKN